MIRKYHIVAVNDKASIRVQMTGYPMPHADCMVMISKITRYPWRRLILVETHD